MSKLLHGSHQWNHDLGVAIHALLRQLNGRLNDGPDLHRGDLGIGDSETASAVAKHRIHFGKVFHPVKQQLLFRDLFRSRLALLQEGHFDAQIVLLG